MVDRTTGGLGPAWICVCGSTTFAEISLGACDERGVELCEIVRSTKGPRVAHEDEHDYHDSVIGVRCTECNAWLDQDEEKEFYDAVWPED